MLVGSMPPLEAHVVRDGCVPSSRPRSASPDESCALRSLVSPEPTSCWMFNGSALAGSSSSPAAMACRRLVDSGTVGGGPARQSTAAWGHRPGR